MIYVILSGKTQDKKQELDNKNTTPVKNNKQNDDSRRYGYSKNSILETAIRNNVAILDD